MGQMKIAFIGGGKNSAIGKVHAISSQMDKKFKLDNSKNENIAKFLFSKATVPRSYRMIGNLI